MSSANESTRHVTATEPHDLHGMLRWSQLDELWARVREQPAGWYAALSGDGPGDPVPDRPLDEPGLLGLVDDIDATLRRELAQTYCGIVYADHPEAPGDIKILDPRTLGSFCRRSSEPTRPRWVLTRRRPTPAADVRRPAALSEPRWWRRLPGSARWGGAR